MEEPKSEKPYTKYEGEVLYSGAPSDQESMDPLSIDKGRQARGSLEPTESKPEKRRVSLKTKVGVGIAAAALLLGGGSVAAKKAMNQSHPQTTGPIPTSPSPSASKSAEASPSPTASAIDTEPTEASLEIPASLINDPKALVETYENRITQWDNAGATHDNAYEAMMSSTENIDEYAARVAAQYDKEFTDALLVKDWQSNPELKYAFDNIMRVHKETLALFIYTSFRESDAADKQPYMRGQIGKFDSVTDQTDKSVTVVTTAHDYDNADLNRVGEALTAGKKVIGEKNQVTLTFIVENGQTKLSDFKDLTTPAPAE